MVPLFSNPKNNSPQSVRSVHFTPPQCFYASTYLMFCLIFLCLFVFCLNLSVSDDIKEEGLYRKIMMYHSVYLNKKKGITKNRNRNLFFSVFKEKPRKCRAKQFVQSGSENIKHRLIRYSIYKLSSYVLL